MTKDDFNILLCVMEFIQAFAIFHLTNYPDSQIHTIHARKMGKSEKGNDSATHILAFKYYVQLIIAIHITLCM